MGEVVALRQHIVRINPTRTKPFFKVAYDLKTKDEDFAKNLKLVVIKETQGNNTQFRLEACLGNGSAVAIRKSEKTFHIFLPSNKTERIELLKLVHSFAEAFKKKKKTSAKVKKS